jgi:hypothetical protein
MKLAGEIATLATMEGTIRAEAPNGVLRIQTDDRVSPPLTFSNVHLKFNAHLK